MYGLQKIASQDVAAPKQLVASYIGGRKVVEAAGDAQDDTFLLFREFDRHFTDDYVFHHLQIKKKNH